MVNFVFKTFLYAFLYLPNCPPLPLKMWYCSILSSFRHCWCNEVHTFHVLMFFTQISGSIVHTTFSMFHLFHDTSTTITAWGKLKATRRSILCSDSMTSMSNERDCWKTSEILLRDCWETAERLLRDCWETAERLLKDCWETAERLHEDWVRIEWRNPKSHRHTDRATSWAPDGAKIGIIFRGTSKQMLE